MMDAALRRIEAILNDLERMNQETGGMYTEPEDKREAIEAVSALERKMLEKAA